MLLFALLELFFKSFESYLVFRCFKPNFDRRCLNRSQFLSLSLNFINQIFDLLLRRFELVLLLFLFFVLLIKLILQSLDAILLQFAQFDGHNI